MKESKVINEEISDELLQHKVAGAIVLNATFKEYLEILSNLKKQVTVIYSRKTFDDNKKLKIIEI